MQKKKQQQKHNAKKNGNEKCKKSLRKGRGREVSAPNWGASIRDTFSQKSQKTEEKSKKNGKKLERRRKKMEKMEKNGEKKAT